VNAEHAYFESEQVYLEGEHASVECEQFYVQSRNLKSPRSQTQKTSNDARPLLGQRQKGQP
jgi:hypothetical protein